MSVAFFSIRGPKRDAFVQAPKPSTAVNGDSQEAPGYEAPAANSGIEIGPNGYATEKKDEHPEAEAEAGPSGTNETVSGQAPHIAVAPNDGGT